jgi:hypothetical protein
MVSQNSFSCFGLVFRPVGWVSSPARYWPALGAHSRIQTAARPDAINGQLTTLGQGDLSRRRNAQIAMRHGRCDG